MIQVYRPVREIEELLGMSATVTDVRLVDGRIQCDILFRGQPRSLPPEEPSRALAPLRVIGATLTSVEFSDEDGNVYYNLARVDQAYVPGGFLERDWYIRDGFVRTLKGARLVRDGIDYDVLDGGQPGVVHVTEDEVLGTLRISGVRIVGVEFKNGTVYYKLASQ